MGTYYSVGIITKFSANSHDNLSLKEWNEVLGPRLDLDLFEITMEENEISGKIKKDVFSENIIDFYDLLREISGPNYNGNLDYYEKEYGADLEQYQSGYETLWTKNAANNRKIAVNTEFALLYIEGKVLVEEFETDPQLINWLFRNSRIPNKLAGAVISSIV
ncbi:transcriptional regulator [Bacillus sp. OxB-1]|uniref:hypothetical protein n=1 Tax=Bacillus sp. (strain OxB-1) TaxID=98228 RepID=UPI000582101D|nr:hypothetical protein [Bacillus sp. OxB-1]BAQ09090.1 transcriptional regulator [Bacillus sp. OxB-1]